MVRAKGWAGKPRAFGLSIPADGWRWKRERPFESSSVSTLLNFSSSRRHLVVGGDFNEEVGATKDSLWRHVMGPYGDGGGTFAVL